MAQVAVKAHLALISMVAICNIEPCPVHFSGAGGTLAIFIPTRDGLSIAADMRQSPAGIFCDGINKILRPERPRTAVVVTGNMTLRDISNVPKAELCDYLAQNRAPVDFGRSALEFLNSKREL